MKITLDKHVHDGGTFVTNFDIKDLPLYEAAISFYEREADRVGFPKRTLILVDRPSWRMPRSEGGSLHYVGDDFNLSHFWLVFDAIRKGRKL